MGTLVLSPQRLADPGDETQPRHQAETVDPRESLAAPDEAPPLAEVTIDARAAPRFDLDL